MYNTHANRAKGGCDQGQGYNLAPINKNSIDPNQGNQDNTNQNPKGGNDLATMREEMVELR